jgi:hypothetical protein
VLDGGDHGGGVADGVEWQAGGVGPDQLGVLVRLGVDRLAVPLARREGEPDPGVTAAGVALVDRQDMTELRGSRVIPVSSRVSRTAAARMLSPWSK